MSDTTIPKPAETKARPPIQTAQPALDPAAPAQTPLEQAFVQRALARPSAARPADVLALQKMVGNRAIVNLFTPTLQIQSKSVQQQTFGQLSLQRQSANAKNAHQNPPDERQQAIEFVKTYLDGLYQPTLKIDEIEAILTKVHKAAVYFAQYPKQTPPLVQETLKQPEGLSLLPAVCDVAVFFDKILGVSIDTQPTLVPPEWIISARKFLALLDSQKAKNPESDPNTHDWNFLLGMPLYQNKGDNTNIVDIVIVREKEISAKVEYHPGSKHTQTQYASKPGWYKKGFTKTTTTPEAIPVATLGTLYIGTDVLKTLELPNRQNRGTTCVKAHDLADGEFGYLVASRVPAGTYDAEIETGGNKGWRIELSNVPGRTEIQIHIRFGDAATGYDEILGCIQACTSATGGGAESQTAMNIIKEYVQPKKGSRKNVKVTIVD